MLMIDLKMKYVKTAVTFILMMFTAGVYGQVNRGVESLLNPGQIQKYRKGGMLIEKGMKVIDRSDSLSGNETKMLMRESEMKYDQAHLPIYDGYLMKVKALENYIEDSKNTNPEISNNLYFLHSKLDRGIKEAHKSYGRSNRTPNIKKVLEHQKEAIDELKKLLAEVEQGLLEINGISSQEKLIAENDSVTVEEEMAENAPESVSGKNAVTEETIVYRAVSVDSVRNVPRTEGQVSRQVVQPDTTVYFAIQVIADRVRVTKDRLDRVYFGNRKISENIGDGWYRYKVGHFKTYYEAAATMKRENIKGFIVAYKGLKRIHVAEAIKLSGGHK